MMSAYRILIVEDDKKMRDGLQYVMKKEGYFTDVSASGEEAFRCLKTSSYDLIISDMKLPGIEGLDVLRAVKNFDKNIGFIIITAYGTVTTAVESMKEGADDYVLKPFDMEELKFVVKKVFEKRELLTKNILLQSQLEKKYRFENIIGTSEGLIKVFKLIKQVANSKTIILVRGETGTGKELAARAVHILRNGARQKFVAINCAALTANLLESELFGHTKGSFTSADREKTGLLELADGGTVFLDEISEMPLDLQAKLLRVLQERRFRKVGGLEEIECKATLIASSNRNLLQEVENGRFRRDLYYRLCVCPIPLAPLRAESRKEDILLLAEYFIQTSTICPEKKGKIKGLTSMAAEMLTRYHWPGNVRELKNVIERAILLEAGDRIGTANLLLNPALAFEMDQAEGNANSLRIKDFSLEKAEKELVKKALDEAGWQKSRAASLLGITRATLYAKVKQYNLQEPEKKPQPVL